MSAKVSRNFEQVKKFNFVFCESKKIFLLSSPYCTVKMCYLQENGIIDYQPKADWVSKCVKQVYTACLGLIYKNVVLKRVKRYRPSPGRHGRIQYTFYLTYSRWGGGTKSTVFEEGPK